MFINGSNPRKIPITCLPPFNFTKKKDKFHELIYLQYYYCNDILFYILISFYNY